MLSVCSTCIFALQLMLQLRRGGAQLMPHLILQLVPQHKYVTQCVRSRCITRVQRACVDEAMRDLLREVRHDAVPLVDAFEFPDNVLNSALGRHDGRVYESLYTAAKASPLNRVDPFRGYTEHLRPSLDRAFIAAHAKQQRVGALPRESSPAGAKL